MFIRSSLQKPIPPILVEDSRFATITIVQNDGEIDVALKFKISQLYAIKVDAYTVNVTVRNSKVSLSSNMFPANSNSVAKGLINNIVKQGQLTKGTAFSNTQNIIDFKYGDVLGKMNKATLTRLHAFSNVNDKEFLQNLLLTAPYASMSYGLRSVIDAKNAGANIPVLQRYMVTNDHHDVIITNAKSKQMAAFKSTIDNDIQLVKPTIVTKPQMRYASLLESISPAMIDATNTHVMSAKDAVAGVMRHSPAQTQHLGELIDAMTLPVSPTETTLRNLSNDDKVLTLTKAFAEYVPLTVNVTIPNPYDKQTLNANGTVASYYVTIELTDVANGKTIDSITKTLDVSSLMNLYAIPRERPRVAAGIVQQARSHLDIQVTDQATSDVIVYRKVLRSISQLNVDTKFEVLGTKKSLTNKLGSVTNVSPGRNIHIYRVIPIGASKTRGSTFTDVVVSSDKRYYNKFVSVAASPTRTGITIELRGFSYDVIAVQVMRRDMTIFEKDFTQVGDEQLVTDESRGKNALFFYDYDLKQEHVYEYCANLIFKGGTKQQFGSAMIEYLAFVDGIDTQISDVQIRAGGTPDVSFNLLTRISKDNLDDVVAMLEAQNLKTYFSDDILKEREKLESLIAHSVVRVNLTEGIREDFGVITDSLFVDSVHKKRNAVSDINVNNIYRYEVSALLRAPETMFSEYKREVKDAITGKTYTFSPSKYLHPITLTKGNIFTTAALDAHYSKKSMMFGRVGNFETVDIVFTRSSVSVENAVATQYGDDIASVVWTVSGDSNTIDHFIIMSINNGIKRIVGSTHPHFETRECKFIHSLTPADHGYVRYSIIPVLNDYTQLAETLTNFLVIQ